LGIETFMFKIKVFKLIGCCVWTLLFGIVFMFLNKILSKWFSISFHNTSLLSFSFIIQQICLVLYFITLQPTPCKLSILPFNALFARVLFVISLFAWLYFLALAQTDSWNANIIALIVSFVTFMTNKFTIVFSLRKRSRISQIFHSWNIPIVASIVISVIVAVFLGMKEVLTVFTLFFVSSCSLTICSVIAGERTAFASNNGKLIFTGLSSTDAYTRFLAFIDLYEITGGPSSRRDFIFKDASRRNMNDLAKCCHAIITAMLQQHLQLQHYRGNSIPAAQISNSLVKRAAFDASMMRKHSDENFILKFFRMRREKVMKERRETYAIQATVTGMFAAQSLVRFIALLPSEDKFGVGQASMDQIMLTFVNAKSVLGRSEGYHWAIRSFGKNWIAKNPADLTRQALNIFNWAISELRVRHVPIPNPTM